MLDSALRVGARFVPKVQSRRVDGRALCATDKEREQAEDRNGGAGCPTQDKELQECAHLASMLVAEFLSGKMKATDGAWSEYPLKFGPVSIPSANGLADSLLIEAAFGDDGFAFAQLRDLVPSSTTPATT